MSAAEEIMDGDSREIALREAPRQAGLTLFGSDDPAQIAAQIVKVADVVTRVISDKKLFSVINGRKFVMVEGWTVVGSLVGVFPVVRWSRPIEVDGVAGWEARVEAVTLSGAVVGAAESMCTRKEANWKTRDDNAIRSMAQTRATSKALRQPLDFLVKMAGFVATPAEEMEDQSEPRAAAAQPKAGVSPAAAAPKPPVDPTANVDTLTEEVVQLGIMYRIQQLRAFGSDPDEVPADKMRADVLAELDKSALKKYGSPLSKLNATTLKELTATLAARLEEAK